MPSGCKPQMGTGDQVVARDFRVYFSSEYTEYFFYFSFLWRTPQRGRYLITVHYVQCIVIFWAKMGADKTCARDIVHIVPEGVALQ